MELLQKGTKVILPKIAISSAMEVDVTDQQLVEREAQGLNNEERRNGAPVTRGEEESEVYCEGEDEKQSSEHMRLILEGGEGEGKRIPLSYRRRKILESQMRVEGRKGEKMEEEVERDGVVEHEERMAIEEEAILAEEEARRKHNSREGRRVTFSERRRRRFGGENKFGLRTCAAGRSPLKGGKEMSCRMEVTITEERGREEEEEQREGSRERRDSRSVTEGREDCFLEAQRYERAPEETMQVLRERSRMAKARKEQLKNTTETAGSLTRFEYLRGPTWPRENVFGDNANIMDCENTALAMMAALENKVTEMIDKKSLSEDVLQWLRADVSILDNELRTNRDETVETVNAVRGRVKREVQTLRLKMVALMTETTQFTFEALEDVRSALITQILADEEQVQWELEKMDAQVGEIAKPLALLHHLTSQFGSLPSNLSIADATALMSSNTNPSEMATAAAAASSPSTILAPPDSPPPPSGSLPFSQHLLEHGSIPPATSQLHPGLHALSSLVSGSLPLSSSPSSSSSPTPPSLLPSSIPSHSSPSAAHSSSLPSPFPQRILHISL